MPGVSSPLGAGAVSTTARLFIDDLADIGDLEFKAAVDRRWQQLGAMALREWRNWCTAGMPPLRGGWAARLSSAARASAQ